MSWLFFALLAPVLDTVILYIDRYVIEREVQDYRGLVIFGTIIGFIAGTVYWILAGFPLLNLNDTVIILITGMFSIWGLGLYYKALSLEETSRIIIFFKAIPVMILVLSFLLLRETITIRQFVGFLIIFFSIIGVSFKRSSTAKQGGIFSSGLFLILIVDILWALAAVLVKFAINLNSFAKIISYESWGIGLGGLMLYLFFPTIRHSFHTTIRTIRKQALVILIINECLYLVSRAITFYAYSLGPTALVSVIGGVQVFYGILFGLILTTINPRVFHEDIRRMTLVKKFYYAVVLIVGIYLVT